MITEIQAKSILTTMKEPEKWFGVRYNMNLYRGCEHGCIYCDSRSQCYGIEDFDRVAVKTNAISLLQKELSSKCKIDTIGTGAMSDPYTPAETEYKMTRKALELIAAFKYPVHICTKSDRILRDIDLLKAINRIHASAAVTITTLDKGLASVIEPNAPSPSARLAAIEKLAAAGIYVGVLMMPVLPYLEDRADNIDGIIAAAHGCGASFVIPWMGMSLRDRQREYYYRKLDAHFPGLKKRYIESFGNQYACNSANAETLYAVVKEQCKKYGMAYRMKDLKTYSSPEPVQLSFFPDGE